GAKILAHHQRRGTVRLQCDDADHRFVVIAHVSALSGRLALRYPPQPEQPDDVVDAYPAGVPEHGADQRPERLILTLFESVRAPRWLRPVLAQLVELIR